MPGRIIDVLHSWEEAGSQAIDRDRWRTVPASVWWTSWKERNSRCFEDVGNSLQKIKLNCLLIFSSFWCKQTYSEESVDIIDVLSSI